MTSIAFKKNNNLPLWGNEKTMNMNSLILTNILSSHYFKVDLYGLKTYHEVIDEIYYKVNHLEPWEKGSRVTSGQTGMCGGVRGVGAGGIVSTAYCILYKLCTLKLTRKQVVGLINHGDSPYIRALGFMYIRYTQPPGDLWEWYLPYLDDDEKLDVKAGSGKEMMIGEMLWHFLSKLEWFSTLFPRIPVPIQKELEKKMADWKSENKWNYSKSNANDEISNEDHYWEKRMEKSPVHKNERCKNSNDLKDNEHRESSEDYYRERRQRTQSKDRHERSKHYHSLKPSASHGRSRSPYDSQSYSDSKIHYSRHRNSEKSSHHTHRDRSREHKHSRDSRSRSNDQQHSHGRSQRRYNH